jgi:20S proteasome alpha/beta subunit
MISCLRPFPRRLPERKRMTAIVGLQCTDGVLLLADTEETISQESKGECDKLSVLQLPHGRVLLGGAGLSHFIEYAQQAIERDFLASSRTWPEILVDANALFRKINRDTLGFYKGFAAEFVPEGIALLTAVNSNGHTNLCRWQNDSVVAVDPRKHDSVGCGIHQTYALLRDINIRMGADAMLFYGVRVMKQAKRRVNGVGGKTEAVVLHHDGTVGYFSTGITAQIEELVLDVDSFTNGSFLSLIADVYSKDEEFEHLLSQVTDKIREYRESYRRSRFRY